MCGRESERCTMQDSPPAYSQAPTRERAAGGGCISVDTAFPGKGQGCDHTRRMVPFQATFGALRNWIRPVRRAKIQWRRGWGGGLRRWVWDHGPRLREMVTSHAEALSPEQTRREEKSSFLFLKNTVFNQGKE